MVGSKQGTVDQAADLKTATPLQNGPITHSAVDWYTNVIQSKFIPSKFIRCETWPLGCAPVGAMKATQSVALGNRGGGVRIKCWLHRALA